MVDLTEGMGLAPGLGFVAGVVAEVALVVRQVVFAERQAELVAAAEQQVGLAAELVVAAAAAGQAVDFVPGNTPVTAKPGVEAPSVLDLEHHPAQDPGAADLNPAQD